MMPHGKLDFQLPNFCSFPLDLQSKSSNHLIRRQAVHFPQIFRCFEHKNHVYRSHLLDFWISAQAGYLHHFMYLLTYLLICSLANPQNMSQIYVRGMTQVRAEFSLLCPEKPGQKTFFFPNFFGHQLIF